MVTIEIKQEWFGDKYIPEKHEKYLGEYLVEEWNFGEREEVMELSSEQVTDDAGAIKFIVRSSKFRVNTLLKCIKNAPYKVSIANIKKMPIGVAEFLYDVVSDLNEAISGEELKKFYEA